jgi:hypothetical protein
MRQAVYGGIIAALLLPMVGLTACTEQQVTIVSSTAICVGEVVLDVIVVLFTHEVPQVLAGTTVVNCVNAGIAISQTFQSPHDPNTTVKIMTAGHQTTPVQLNSPTFVIDNCHGQSALVEQNFTVQESVSVVLTVGSIRYKAPPSTSSANVQDEIASHLISSLQIPLGTSIPAQSTFSLNIAPHHEGTIQPNLSVTQAIGAATEVQGSTPIETLNWSYPTSLQFNGAPSVTVSACA